MNVNKALLCGRVVQDPQLKVTTGGYPVCSFSLATNTIRKSKTGEKIEEVDFHNVVVFGRLAEVVGQYVVKGQLLFVEGRIRNTSYLVQDVKKYKSEILVSNLQFGAKPQCSSAPTAPVGTSPTVSNSPEHNIPIPVIGENQTEEEVKIEDIPF